MENGSNHCIHTHTQSAVCVCVQVGFFETMKLIVSSQSYSKVQLNEHFYETDNVRTSIFLLIRSFDISLEFKIQLYLNHAKVA